MTNFELMHKRLEERAGLVPPPKAPHAGKSFDAIRKQECSDGFCEMMDNRLVMGYLRYGPMQSKKPLFYDLERCLLRLQTYRETGNTELLVDAANYCRCEFKRSQHPKKHFHAVDRE